MKLRKAESNAKPRYEKVSKVASAKDIATASAAPVTLKRYEQNPIISPDPNHDWESFVTTNPGACYDDNDGTIKLLYRAAGHDKQHMIHFGLAVSNDGYQFKRFDKPALSPSIDGIDAGCLEDARIVKMGSYFYITYATRMFPPGQYWLNDGRCFKPVCPDEFPLCVRENHTSSALLLTQDFKSFIRAGRLTDPLLDDRDVILFPERIDGKFVMLHRPLQWCGEKYGTQHPAIWISTADDLLGFRQSKLLAKAKYPWEFKVGCNTPPVRTKHGWLTLYHAVGYDKYYRLGAMLLDLDDPSRVIHRTKGWIFQPEEEYEKNGCYSGGGVVFPCGKVVMGDTLFVYYGAADKYVGLATCCLSELLEYLLTCPS